MRMKKFPTYTNNIDSIKKQIPVQRLGEPQNIALAADDADFIIGWTTWSTCLPNTPICPALAILPLVRTLLVLATNCSSCDTVVLSCSNTTPSDHPSYRYKPLLLVVFHA